MWLFIDPRTARALRLARGSQSRIGPSSTRTSRDSRTGAMECRSGVSFTGSNGPTNRQAARTARQYQTVREATRGSRQRTCRRCPLATTSILSVAERASPKRVGRLLGSRKTAPATWQNLCAEVVATGCWRKNSRSPHRPGPSRPAWYRGCYSLACFGRRRPSASPSRTQCCRSTAARHCHDSQAHPRRSDRRTDTRFSDRQTSTTGCPSIPSYAPSC
jgi:hypothetical protein